MARTHRTQSVITGNYVTFFMTNKSANAGTTAVADRIPMPMPFRIVRVSSAVFGSVGTTSMSLATRSRPSEANVGTQLFSTATLTNAVAVTTSPGSFNVGTNNIDPRNVPANGHLEMLTTSATSIPAGGAGMWITGYFTEQITGAGVNREPGEYTKGGPEVGYYDNIHLANLLDLTGSVGDSVHCEMVVPYDCRVMAVQKNSLGETEVGAIQYTLVKNAATDIFATVNLTSTDNVFFDANSANPLVTAARDLVRGDTLELFMNSDNAGDRVPIQAMTLDVLVWVKGHARDESVEPLIED